MKFVKELDFDNKKNLAQKIEDMCNLYKDMKQYADQLTMKFESQEELNLYYSVTDHLNTIIDRKTNQVLMEKDHIWPTIKELVRIARSFQAYLSTGIEDFCKPLPSTKGTVKASREKLAEKILVAQSKNNTEKMK